jgi:hypothetical protein
MRLLSLSAPDLCPAAGNCRGGFDYKSASLEPDAIVLEGVLKTDQMEVRVDPVAERRQIYGTEPGNLRSSLPVFAPRRNKSHRTGILPHPAGSCSVEQGDTPPIMFHTNEGGLDRTLRICIGIGALAMTQLGPQTPWGYIGIVPLITGLAGTCPVYSIFGWNTCPLKKT